MFCDLLAGHNAVLLLQVPNHLGLATVKEALAIWDAYARIFRKQPGDIGTQVTVEALMGTFAIVVSDVLTHCESQMVPAKHNNPSQLAHIAGVSSDRVFAHDEVSG